MTEHERQQISDTAATQAADTVKTGLKALTPASTGWILAVVLIIIAIQIADYFANERLTEFLVAHQQHQAETLQSYISMQGEQSRRYQETIRELTDAVIRDSERAGRAALTAIDRTSENTTDILKQDILERQEGK